MNVILVSSRLARSISLESRQVVLIVTLALLLTASGAFLLGAMLAPGAAKMPLLNLLPGAASRQAEMDSLALKLGELQAKLVRLDGLVKRVGSKTGVDTTPFTSDQPAPRGGTATPGQAPSAISLFSQLKMADTQLTAYQDQLMLLESSMMLPNASLFPTLRPAPPQLAMSSLFGGRTDPFTGRQTFHEGIDFPGPTGTPILASGGGTVIFAGWHSEYGNIVEIDHGNSLVSRYAHNSQLNVAVGDKVKPGQTIALLGSTGRSTGAHLHYEIRYKNVPQNPLRFMATDISTNKTAGNTR